MKIEPKLRSDENFLDIKAYMISIIGFFKEMKGKYLPEEIDTCIRLLKYETHPAEKIVIEQGTKGE